MARCSREQEKSRMDQTSVFIFVGEPEHLLLLKVSEEQKEQTKIPNVTFLTMISGHTN